MNYVRPFFNTALLVLLTAATLPAAPQLRREQGHVTGVFDGDTIVVDRGGRGVTVRLIGVDTPETARPETPVQFYGPEASEFTRTSLQGTDVWLEFEPRDRPGGGVDRYGRTLAYVITAGGTNFNLELVRKGYGRVYARYPFTYLREFRQAERQARAADLGLWNKRNREAWSDPAKRGRIIGNIRSHIYHLPAQDGYSKVLEKNRIYFPTEEDAVKAGYRKARPFPANGGKGEAVSQE